MEIVAIRHLQTKFNAAGLLQGRLNIDILEPDAVTMLSIKNNIDILSGLGEFDMVLTSSFLRTISTSTLYGFTDSKVDFLLDELDYGPFEGKPKKEMEEMLGQGWQVDPREIILGESLLNFEKRVLSFINDYQIYNRLLIFGHGTWIRALRSISEFGDIRAMNRFSMENNEMQIITI